MSLQVASLPKRGLSFLIDDIIINIFVFFIFYDQMALLVQSVPIDETMQIDQEALALAIKNFLSQNLIYILLLKVLYQAIPIGFSGMTPGKYITKTKVVRVDGSNIGYLKSFIRAIIRLISEMSFYLGFIVAFFVSKRQTMHGFASESIVIDTQKS